ncbi:Uncharacterized protein Adt_41786 [Abeliophyllum distichum]|uniref:Retrotransposon gag domain-containing protein n=1 Tax=Abeliophyllum distichum TaxID=126358 RepID=A0ABD1PPU3_9LAMI
MAETRSKSNEKHLKKLDREVSDLGMAIKSSDQTLKAVCTKQERMEQLMMDMNGKYESIVSMLAQMSGNKLDQKEKRAIGIATPHTSSRVLEFEPGNTSAPVYEKGKNRMNTKLPKIDFPYFSGEGPREWLRKTRKYFHIHQVPEEMRLGIAEMYLKGKADIWFQGFIYNQPNANWGLFSTEICRRFSDTTVEEVIEVFSKIRQRGSISEYRSNLRN